ncbi:Uu.00g046590.m01.CDS01 [Anthostomella pinea]|uniref:Uu.00g046590.m01.CDS01 n=1 Tax=Anthostomella pinea TaxID=933095 RepID=A0AAI8VCD5_9PEZI|nr:Uu.00g046590.m01.CDS01 [Anthostomella pinea]
MEGSNSTPTAASGRSKAAKSRNTDVRKEQNRVASRAYREKRRQKLALLDELLKSDSCADSMSSVSDETDAAQTPLSISQSRHASKSPAPPTLPTIPVAAQWPPVAQAMGSSGPTFGQETYASYWMDCFDRPGDFVTANTTYSHPFIPTDVDGSNLGTSSSQYITPIPSIPSMPSTPQFPAESEPSDRNLAPYHTSSLPSNSVHDLPSLPGYDSVEIPALESDMMNALESLAKLNDAQQQQILTLIQKKRSASQSMGSDHSFHPRLADYHAGAPTSVHKQRHAIHHTPW